MEEEKKEPGMDLKVESTLPVLAFNMEELKAQALALAGKYNGLVFTEEQITEVRKDMAYLNQVVERLDDARKATVKRMEGPIKAFTAQVQELREIILSARAGLAKQVQDYVDTAREEKRVVVLAMIEQARKDFPGVSSEFAVEMRDSWLAASTAKSKVLAEVGALFAGEEKRRKDTAALDTAKQERAMAVEQKLQTINKALDLSLSMASFLDCLDLKRPLGEVYEQMEEVAGEAARAKRLEEEQAKAAEPERANPAEESATAPEQEQVPESGPDAPPPPSDAGADKRITFSALCAPDKLEDVKVLLRKVFNMCTDVSVKIS